MGIKVSGECGIGYAITHYLRESIPKNKFGNIYMY